MNELGIQKALCDAAIAEGGYAYKQNNQFIAGVADLLVQLPGLPTVAPEIKYQKRLLGLPRGLNARVRLTPLQVRYVRRMVEAGGYAGWVLVVALPRVGDFFVQAGCYLSEDDNLEFMLPDNRTLTRKRGEKWPIREIVKTILEDHGAMQFRRAPPTPSTPR